MVDELIEDLIRTDREITVTELRSLREAIAVVGFDPVAITRAGAEVAGVVWSGKVVESHDRLPNEVQHYLRHVTVGQEWPPNTLIDEYTQSLRDTVLDENGAISLETFPFVRRLTFLGRSGKWHGPSGGPWILGNWLSTGRGLFSWSPGLGRAGSTMATTSEVAERIDHNLRFPMGDLMDLPMLEADWKKPANKEMKRCGWPIGLVGSLNGATWLAALSAYRDSIRMARCQTNRHNAIGNW